MAAIEPAVHAAELRPGSFVVSVSGSIEGETTTRLRDTIIPLVAADEAHVVLDLTEADHLDRTAVASLAAAAEIAGTCGGSLCLVGLRVPVRRLLALWGVEHLFATAPTLTDALRVHV